MLALSVTYSQGRKKLTQRFTSVAEAAAFAETHQYGSRYPRPCWLVVEQGSELDQRAPDGFRFTVTYYANPGVKVRAFETLRDAFEFASRNVCWAEPCRVVLERHAAKAVA